MESLRIEIIGQDEFVPREWLRREVLWAYLEASYTEQLNGWLSERPTFVNQHNNNIGRRDLFEKNGQERNDPDLLAQAFFNQGKIVSSAVSAVALFKASMAGSGEGAAVNVLEIQAQSVDRVLKLASDGTVGELTPAEEEAICEGTARLARGAVDARLTDTYGDKIRFKRAGNTILALAGVEAAAWISASQQDETGTLPLLTVPNGGTPRSTGPLIERRQTMLHNILASEAYQALSGYVILSA